MSAPVDPARRAQLLCRIAQAEAADRPQLSRTAAPIPRTATTPAPAAQPRRLIIPASNAGTKPRAGLSNPMRSSRFLAEMAKPGGKPFTAALSLFGPRC